MHVVIAGGTGLLGRALTERLLADGHAVRILTRHVRGATRDRVQEVEWRPDGTTGPWQQALEGAVAVINLTGAGIADKRWTDERKKELHDSRVLSAQSLVAAISAIDSRPPVFVQSSGVGYYGADLSDQIHDESSPHGRDFLAQLCVAWEGAAHPVERLGCRLVLARTGVVFAPRGGALEQMARPFKLFSGGPVASGRQYLSWIHLDDYLNQIVWIIRHADLEGPVNVTSPHPVTNAEFGATLARTLHRPNWMPVPAVALRVLFGEMADAILINGQRVVPARSQALGFSFTHSNLTDALAAIYG